MAAKSVVTVNEYGKIQLRLKGDNGQKEDNSQLSCQGNEHSL